ncbi:cell division inhibitor SepF [Geodermatophilus amargosae]|uniref:Cell division protein SepF n=1 Tax=Geodermatophilus amargosae TaxID=1296565 RepID=A0A1I7ASH8_9ACTN|nr:cell division protein SepF [Geodermatophilus amargosae]SFT77847.1 cell division inhibitor SepF [Geodermatophilus amargosae]
MAGAMRKMGIYLGLVEDDDARAYGRYDVRQSDHHDRYDEGRYDDGRYDEGRFDEGRYDPARYDDGRYDSGRYDERRYDRLGESYPGERTDEGRRRESDRHDGERYDNERYDGDRVDDGRPAVRAAAPTGPEPAVLRRAGATRIGLAQPVSGVAPAASGPSRIGAVSGGAGGAAAGLAAREPVTVAPEPAPAPVVQPYRITTLHPKTYNEARAIGEAFRDGSPVIMNLTELDHADARRLVDFAAGLVFGLRGSIEPVTAKVFLLSPRDVDVTAEDKAKIREGGFFEES